MTPSSALNLVNLALAGAVLLVAADSAMRVRYPAPDPSFKPIVYGTEVAKGVFPARFKATFKKETKDAPVPDLSAISGLIKLSGVFAHPADPLKSSAVFVIKGKESVLKRIGEEVVEGVSLESIDSIGAVVKRDGVETALHVESGGAEEGVGRLLITSDAQMEPQEVSNNQKAQPALVTSDPGQKIVKPILR